MNKILFLFILIISCNNAKDFEEKSKIVTSYKELVSIDSNIEELLDFDQEGNFYLTSKSTKQIYKYSKNGKLLAKTGGVGRGPNEFEEDKILNIDVGKKQVIAFSIGGNKIVKYDTYLQIIDSYLVEKPILSVIFINDQKTLISYLDLKTNNSLEVRDSEFNKLYSGFNMLHLSSPFYGFIFSTSALSKNHFVVGYLAVNHLRVFSIEGNLIAAIKVPGFPDKSPPLEGNPDVVPTYLLFRDIDTDSLSNNILILAGDKNYSENNSLNYSGSNRVHVLSFEGTYQYTMVLPMEIEQIAYFDENIYGLQIDSSTTKVIKFNRIK